MKFILDNWMLMVIALTSGSMLLWPTLKGATDAGLSPDAAVQLINREKAVVVDICEKEEYASAHVSGAKNVPLSEFGDKLASVVKNKSLPLILVCQSGARSARAVAQAKQLGYERVHSLSGGLGAWRSASLPVEKA